ncbi:hypothetical protein [Sulfoacidibacillus thermotolerans]|uniref:hypothetical protein n=1 Tax=Sulfoacidibacillus thermotolerans TaxID=1765684 RepID=UPI0015E819FA|nr:hypothetical protein [Sulfoacidibacillus thermotolerans]
MKDMKILIVISSIFLSAFLMLASTGVGVGVFSASSGTYQSSPLAITDPGVL